MFPRNPVLILTLLSLMMACAPKLTEEELVARAQEAFASGDVAAAEVDVKAALQKNPENALARSLYGEIYLRKMNSTAAVVEFERSLAVSESPATLLNLVTALAAAGESAEVVSDFEAGVYDAISSDAEFNAILARSYLAQAKPKEAQEILNSISEQEVNLVDITRAEFALQLDQDFVAAKELLLSVVERAPTAARAWSILGLIATSEDDREAARGYFAKAVDANPFRLRDRMQFVDASIRLGRGDEVQGQLAALEGALPDYPDVNFLRGQLQFDAGEFSNALDSFSRVLLARPAHPGALLLSANANARLDNWVTAENLYTQFLDLQPRHREARLQLAEVWRMLGEPEKTEQVARSLLEEDEMNIPALNLLAIALATQGLTAESAEVYDKLAVLRPESAQAQIAAASQKLALGDVDAGLAQMSTAVEVEPDNTAARERLIDARIAAGDLEGAADAVNEYQRLAPDSPRALMYASRILWLTQDYDGAKSIFEEMLELDSGSVPGNAGMAALASRDGDTVVAESYLQTALDANPGDLTTSMNLAAILQIKGDRQKMREVLSGAIKANPDAPEPRIALAGDQMLTSNTSDAIETLLPLERMSAWDYRVPQALAAAYLAGEQPDVAERYVGQLLQLRADDPNALFLAARVATANGSSEAAENYLTTALTKLEDSVDLRKALIENLVAQGKLPNARDEIAKLPTTVQNETPLLLLRGRLALASQNLEQAESLFAIAYDQQPNSVNLAYLAGVQWAMGKNEQVVDSLENWLRENPEDTLIRGELATRQLELGNEIQARELYSVLADQHPDNVIFLNNLAWLSRSEDNELALELIAKADRIAPDSAQIKDTFAMVMLESGDTDRALALNTKALEEAPDSADIRFNRAKILSRGGRIKEAKRLLEELLESPEFSSRESAQMLLNTL